MPHVDRLKGEQSDSAGHPAIHERAGYGLGAFPNLISFSQRAADAVSHAIKSVSSAALWGAGGFLTGVIFWHCIGFWGFVSDVVFSNRAHLDDRQIAQSGPQCIEFVLERATGTIHAEPCAMEAPELDESANSAKGDFLSHRQRLARGPRSKSVIKLTSGEK